MGFGCYIVFLCVVSLSWLLLFGQAGAWLRPDSQGIRHFIPLTAELTNPISLTSVYANVLLAEPLGSLAFLVSGAWLRPDSQGIRHFNVGGGRFSLIRSTTGIRIPSSVCTRRSDEFDTNGISSSRRSEQVRSRQAAARAAARGWRRGREESWEEGRRLLEARRLETSPHDPLGITDSACKNQLVVVSVQYGPFNTYIPIRSTTIDKSRVARDPITMHTSWRSNSDIASVTGQIHLPKTHSVLWPEIYYTIISSDSIGYPRIKASGESSTTKHRLLHASEPHPIPPPNDPKTNQYNQDLGLIHSTNGNHLESPNEGSSIDHQVSKVYQLVEELTQPVVPREVDRVSQLYT
ncbi:hypothetical protein F511_42727 [Dorcoceras hygrometricum]|uniref:Uncharacterized protein n=1 Tax=Dorcoceras hygrometricum TaxID=472368 RepID=A0A2Z7CD69_9LAMI|nr:hypothetical protein F511_42727 [Dorcoceras hygrometricum]